MSLWTKAVSDVDYSDIEQFCLAKLPEGARLDYKRSIPNDLPATVASFANTLGGMIVFGVDVDRTTNIPEWPPENGIGATKGFSERITQICTDNIYPPILPAISTPVIRPEKPEVAIAIIKVDQSPVAPHAIQNKTQICVRVGDTAKRVDLADVDRIEQMFRQRDRHVSTRREFIDRNHSRILRLAPAGFNTRPAFWLSVCPEFPWQDICTADTCLEMTNEFELAFGPRGAIGVQYKRSGASTSEVDLLAVESSGCTYRAKLKCADNGGFYLSLDEIISHASRFFRNVQVFYRDYALAYPGMLRLSVGVLNAEMQRMRWTQSDSGMLFDSSFVADEVVRYETFLEAQLGGMRPAQLVWQLLSRLGRAFGHVV